MWRPRSYREGGVQTRGPWTVIPLTVETQEGAEPPALLSCREAWEQERLRLRESSSQFYLWVEVVGEVPVVLPIQEVLVGGVQNRLPTYPLLLEQETSKLPVFCVERGRSSGDPEGVFQFSPYALPLPVRRAMLEAFMPRYETFTQTRPNFILGLRMAQRRDEEEILMPVPYTYEYSEWVPGAPPTQEAVWEAVAQCLGSHGVESPTQNVLDFYQGKQEEVEAALALFPVQPGQSGVVVCREGRVWGVEWCASSAAWAAYHRPLLASYFLDTGQQGPDLASLGEVDDFLMRLQEVAQERPPVETSVLSRGCCRFFELEVEGQALRGYLLEDKGQPYFLSVLAA